VPPPTVPRPRIAMRSGFIFVWSLALKRKRLGRESVSVVG
jgi:hypothetical protein